MSEIPTASVSQQIPSHPVLKKYTQGSVTQVILKKKKKKRIKDRREETQDYHSLVLPPSILISGGRWGVFSPTWKLAAACVEVLRTACKEPTDKKKILQELDE